MALCQINQSQILILRGIFAFHICLNDLSTPLLQIFLYIVLTENCPFFDHFQMGLYNTMNIAY
jgi:hypothetical protein